jgi:hypothetical protein
LVDFGKIVDTMYPVKQKKLGIFYTNNNSLSAFEFTGWPVDLYQIIFSFQSLTG